MLWCYLGTLLSYRISRTEMESNLMVFNKVQRTAIAQLLKFCLLCIASYHLMNGLSKHTTIYKDYEVEISFREHFETNELFEYCK